MSNAIKPIHTSCKNCVFSVYDNITQNDCELKYLDIYKKNNVEILEAYDNDKEFYVINDKKCIGYREPKWFDALGMSDASNEEKIAKYFDSNYINYFAILDTLEINKDQFDSCIKALSELSFTPQKLIIIRYAYKNNDLPYSLIETTLKKYNINVSWKIQTILDSELSHEDILYQIVTQNNKYRFVLYSKNFNTINSLINTANDIVYKQLKSFNILSNNNKDSILFSIGVYKYMMFSGENILNNQSYYTII